MAKADGTLRVRATLEPRGPAGAIVLTDDQVAELGGGKTPPVLVIVNGVTAQARVGRMGGENLLGFSKKLRSELGVEIGQTVDVVIALDAGPRSVEVPSALAEAFARDAKAKAAFEALAPSRRKEFARWVDEAKRDQTRHSRVEQTLQICGGAHAGMIAIDARGRPRAETSARSARGVSSPRGPIGSAGVGRRIDAPISSNHVKANERRIRRALRTIRTRHYVRPREGGIRLACRFVFRQGHRDDYWSGFVLRWW